METCDNVKNKDKRKFSEAWLNDERYKHWIRQVSSDDTLFYCSICNKNISCSTHVSRHMDSACHKKNIEKNTCGSNSVTKEQEETVRSKRTFRPQWLDIQEFKSWLREVPTDASSVVCLICDKTITARLSDIYRHAESILHKNKSDVEANKSNEGLNTQADESLLTFDERKKSAEIRFAALIAEKNIPHQTAQDILSLFQDIGKDPDVLKSMKMGRTKCKNIISNVLCPVETERAVINIQNTKFSIFIDETSDITNAKWMTFMVRYVDIETLDVRSQLVKLIDIDARDCSAEKLFNAFQAEMYKLQIPFLNILALSCDNASVMTGRHLSFKKKLEAKCKNLLTFSCPCYSAALAAHAACAKIPDFCEGFIRKIANYINGSPKRAAIFNEFCECFQDTSLKILKLCGTRWLSHYECIDRLLESWDTIKHFLNEMVVSEKSKPAEYLLSIMENVDTKAYFLFLKYVLNFFNSYNAFFQAVETRIHLLQPKSVNFLVQISRNFLKPELLKHLLTNISLYEKNNYKSIDDITLGSECEEYLQELMKEGHADVITNIRQNCLQFYITAADEIRKRLPVSNVFLFKLQVFGPQIALLDSNRGTSFNDVSYVAKTLSGFDEDGLKDEWFALYSDFMLEEKQTLATTNFDDMWKKILKRPSTNILKYPHLTSLLNAIRSLPHSNADPERIFSLLTDLKSTKRNRLSSTPVNATCVFKSALKTRRETALNMVITDKHLRLMSTNVLYSSAAKRQRGSLKLYAADDIAGPSSSNDTQ